jgi:hypothetical protein
LANGTDGELITWDAAGAPATVAVGTSGHVLTSNGTGAAPTFQAASTPAASLEEHVSAASIRPRSNSGCAPLAQYEDATSRAGVDYLAFDSSSDEFAQFTAKVPTGSDGTFKITYHWMAAGTSTNGISMACQAIALQDSDSLNQSWGTAVQVTDDDVGTAYDILKTSQSTAVTATGTPAAGDLVLIQIYRDVSEANDDLAEDALLISVDIEWVAS